MRLQYIIREMRLQYIVREMRPPVHYTRDEACSILYERCGLQYLVREIPGAMRQGIDGGGVHQRKAQEQNLEIARLKGLLKASGSKKKGADGHLGLVDEEHVKHLRESLERERKSNAKLKAAIRSALDQQVLPQEGAAEEERDVLGAQDGDPRSAEPCPLPPLASVTHHAHAPADTHKLNTTEGAVDGYGGNQVGKASSGAAVAAVPLPHMAHTNANVGEQRASSARWDRGRAESSAPVLGGGAGQGQGPGSVVGQGEITHKLWAEHSRGSQGLDAFQAAHQLSHQVYSSAVPPHRAAGQAAGVGGGGGRTQQQQQKYHPRGHKTRSYLPAWFPDAADSTCTSMPPRLDHPVQPARMAPRAPQPPRHGGAAGVGGPGAVGKGGGGAENALVQKRLAALGLMPGPSVSTSLAKGSGSGPAGAGKKRKGGGGGVRMSLPAGLGLQTGPDQVGARAESLPDRTNSAHTSGALTERWYSSSVSPHVSSMAHHMPRRGAGGGVGAGGGESAGVVAPDAPKPPAADGVLRVPLRKARHRVLSTCEDPEERLNPEDEMSGNPKIPEPPTREQRRQGGGEGGGADEDSGDGRGEGVREGVALLPPAVPYGVDVPRASSSDGTAGEAGAHGVGSAGEADEVGTGGGGGEVGDAGAEAAAEVEAAEVELKLLRGQLRQLVDRSLLFSFPAALLRVHALAQPCMS